MTTDTGPLAGLRVIELGRYIAAPFAGKLLGDLGADVVKIEDPDGGDPMRRWEGGSRPYSPQFAAYNRNKRSVCLDLKSAEGRRAAKALALDADVWLENFRPGVADRLGIGATALREVNPRLIYCAVNGFGRTGPYADRPSFDTVISAMGGMYSLLQPGDSPSPIGPAMADLLSGMFAVQSVLAALHHRSQAGEGQEVEVSMLGSVAGFLAEAVTSVLETGVVLEPNTRQRRAQAYGAVAKDDRAFIVHLSVPDKFWLAFTDAMERLDWRDDPRFASRALRYENYAALDALFKDQARERARDEWFARFGERDLPHGPLNSIAELCDDEQAVAMGLIEQVDVPGGPPMPMVRQPAGFSASPTSVGRAAPLLGADTAAVLALALDLAERE